MFRKLGLLLGAVVLLAQLTAAPVAAATPPPAGSWTYYGQASYRECQAARLMHRLRSGDACFIRYAVRRGTAYRVAAPRVPLGTVSPASSVPTTWYEFPLVLTAEGPGIPGYKMYYVTARLTIRMNMNPLGTIQQVAKDCTKASASAPLTSLTVTIRNCDPQPGPLGASPPFKLFGVDYQVDFHSPILGFSAPHTRRAGVDATGQIRASITR